ncbi:hypothetical protein PHYBLDRAFT_148239 [Phycomyces blakesleeanus NRRL 1555(-)]|uniref:Uncharacterized protein n=1 Tax=Phycomyces blakesleeanus (strain ATCC 8743b / DSM 1359 / FGSC 10004 / NBRC 33097 / NRRL 1555) TaxID=763407 RepID=A0A162TZ70_PHYB8|nr:hypothetical protein PHYBLDRAFT_148239 [Phycomyces blakesleeanus NRRL 1555(-)]OAD71023.1 hypothetical protein PHYBLDRAFT_148239 [Phycomyces blakesleeanus NRRL 1555(-)]|eukprot:XP_018289063.1 hypothetical protein PHYBLDRAFT_148239 [Phycomyces blakesleeanus NRRL 1555(-)]
MDLGDVMSSMQNYGPPHSKLLLLPRLLIHRNMYVNFVLRTRRSLSRLRERQKCTNAEKITPIAKLVAKGVSNFCYATPHSLKVVIAPSLVQLVTAP